MADISKINPVSSETKDAIRRRSAAILPNHPSASGWSVEAIRKALYEPILAVIDEINRITNEINLAKVNRTTTVNGHALTGNVTVSKSDVGLGNVNNTSDMDKPVSTAQQAALDAAKAVLIQKIDALPKALSAFENDVGYIKNDVENLLHYSKTSDSAYDLRVSYDEETYKITLQLEAPSGQLLGAAHVIDLPIESLVTHAQYQDGNLVLILDNGNELSVPISEIVRGLVGEERTIAGLDLRADITAAALKRALGLDLVENVSIKDLHIFTRFSASADGSDFTEEWSAGQQYVGHAIALEAPTDKSAYTWYWFNDTEEPLDGSEGLAYELSDDGTYYIVTGIGECTDRTVRIPTRYKGLPVTNIAYCAFSFDSAPNMTKIIIPESISTLWNVFEGNQRIQDVVVYSPSIGGGAFLEFSPNKVTFKNTVQYIAPGDDMFSSNAFDISSPNEVICEWFEGERAGYPWGINENAGTFTYYNTNLEYQLSSDGSYYIITGYTPPPDDTGLILVPHEYNGLPVKEIVGFAYWLSVEGVVIPEGVTKILSGLNEWYCPVYLPSTITEIGAGCFSGGSPDLYCRFSEGAVPGAPWGSTGTIIYDYKGGF
ncbi:MAG: hypothetical protein IJW16_02205 [Clostridia bacterium]|nr:hypothetical protein [Clostridia bacterium]